MALLARRGKSEQRTAMRRAGELGKRIEYLAFLLGGESYAIQISSIAEILKPLPITHVPRAARDVLGVMSVRGRLVTVLDLRKRFRLRESPQDRKTRILLVDLGGEELIGFLVDEVVQVYRLADSEIEPANVLGGDQASHIAGIGRPPGSVLVLLDIRPIVER